MSEEPRPVRAWAEYDEWSVFLSEGDGPWLVATPKGSGFGAIVATDAKPPGGVMSWLTMGEPVIYHPGPLRSVRVLLSMGHEVAMERVRRQEADAWWVCIETLCKTVDHTTDADAVARALAEAIAWLERQEEVTA